MDERENETGEPQGSFSFSPSPEDQERAGEEFATELAMARVEKLEGRLTLVAVLVLCLVAGLAFFFYFEFEERIVRVSESGAGKYEVLSKELEENVNELAGKVKAAEAELSSKISELSQVNAKAQKLLDEAGQRADLLEEGKLAKKEADQLFLKERKQTEKAVASLTKETRAEAERLTAQQKTLAQTQEELGGQLADVKSRLEAAQQALADFLEWQMATAGRFEVLKSTLDEMAEQKADSQEVASLLEKQRSELVDLLQKHAREAGQRAAGVESQIVTLQTELEGLQKTLDKGKTGSGDEIIERNLTP